MTRKHFILLASLSLALGLNARQPGTVRGTKDPVFRKDTLSILSYGAVPDGHTLNTKSINDAITALHKRGGGVVLVPAGLWLTGPVVLQSNINLHLASGATLLFTRDFDQYPLVKANWEGLPQMRNQSPVSATDAENIAITGKGIVDGNGDAWRMVKKDKLNETQWKQLLSTGGVLSEDKKTWYPSEKSKKGSALQNPGAISPEKTDEFYQSVKDFLRPNLVLLTSCRNVLLEGVIFQNSPAWCLHPLLCENLVVRGVMVKNPWYAQNGDGIDAESCKRVLIENCVFDVGDDALCMKSGRDAEGRKRGRPIEDVVIRNCTVYAAHGGFVIGSEMSGGARNISVSNCTFIGTDIGLRFKTTRGRGGVVENINIRDIYMKNIVGEAILFDMYYMAKDPIPLAGEKRELPKAEFKPVDETTPVFRNFHISNVYCNGAEKAIFIRGLPEMHVRDIVLENMVLQARKGMDIQEASQLSFRNVKVITGDTDPVIDILQSDNLDFDQLGYSDPAKLLFRLSGDRTSAISISRTDLSHAEKDFSFELGAGENSIISLNAPENRDNRNWSALLAETAMKTWPDSFLMEGDKAAKWRYDQGVILKGMEKVWSATGDGRWFSYIQQAMDFYVQDDGSIRGYKKEDYNIDNINNGKVLLLLYRVTGKEKYKKAADHLREQLRNHPRTSEGGFWHKKVYPYQMWLDGLYMAEPFYAEYASLFHEDTAFNDIARQFILMYRHAADPKTGLLYHGWDESREQPWADKKTGQSPNFWGRSLGWYGMALVDALEYFPENHPKRAELISILHNFAIAVRRVQDKKSGLWFDVPDQPGTPRNYKEASASCMLAYTLAKAVRKGYLPESYLADAKLAYKGILKEFIVTSPSGRVSLRGTVAVSGLGGKPYRDGSFDYYMSEPVVVNDPKGMGAFILCAAEMEMAATRQAGTGKNVVLDYYFNNEWKKDITGTPVRWHYTWDDKSNSGYSMLGDLFTRYGAALKTATTAPSAATLGKASVYIIVDPDTEKETDKPNYMSESASTTIANWVKQGGVLVLLSNDAGNAEFSHFNILAAKFGIRFNEDNKNLVPGNQFDLGAVITPEANEVFGSSRKLYIKELSSLQVQSPATALVTKGDDIIMAVAAYGKGTVFALGDPWIYNEYLDGRKLPAEFENYAGAEAWVKWLLSKAVKK